MLAAFNAKGLIKTQGRQRSDSTHILANARIMTRLEHVAETVRAALNAVATVAPDWLGALAPTEWFERYAKRAEEYRLPRGKAARDELVSLIGQDSIRLLALVDADTAPAECKTLPAVSALRRMWVLEYILEAGRMRWRDGPELGPARERFNSPYDVDAHYGTKGKHHWDGYKVHFTETCDEDSPHLITHVETTSAVLTDVEFTGVIQGALARKGLAPGEHMVDMGFMSVDLVMTSLKQGITLIGPARTDNSWQRRTNSGFDRSKFKIDFQGRTVTRPQGKASLYWKERLNNPRGHREVCVLFSKADFTNCQVKQFCTKKPESARALTFRAEEVLGTQDAQRALTNSPEWLALDRSRAGIEGSISQGVRSLGLRRSRYQSEAKTRLHCVGVAAGVNVQRVAAWLDEVPRVKTRVSRFASLRLVA